MKTATPVNPTAARLKAGEALCRDYVPREGIEPPVLFGKGFTGPLVDLHRRGKCGLGLARPDTAIRNARITYDCKELQGMQRPRQRSNL